MKLKRDWTDAEEKRTYCRICGTFSNVELAHVMGRKYDQPKTPGSKTLYVHPDSVVPLCGPFPEGCHGDQEHGRVDLLPYLTPDEQLRAVYEAGSIDTARRRLCPSEFQIPQQQGSVAAPDSDLPLPTHTTERSGQ